MERLEQEFNITHDDIATTDPEIVIVEKNRRLRRIGETAAVLVSVIALVLMCVFPYWVKKTGYGFTMEMAAGYAADNYYFDTGDYRIFYSTWPLVDENGEEFSDYFIFSGCKPIKKHFWGYTRGKCDSYMVFHDNKQVALLHTIKGENGYYNFIHYTFYAVDMDHTRFDIYDEGFDESVFYTDQVYVNGFERQDGEECELQIGFFFTSSELVESFYIGDAWLNVDTRFVCDSLY